jgi:hypothetical protein
MKAGAARTGATLNDVALRILDEATHLYLDAGGAKRLTHTPTITGETLRLAALIM